MKERGILFQKPMVQAIRRVESPKTQTRRALKIPQWVCANEVAIEGGRWPEGMDFEGDWHPLECPYGLPGDRLWVRETFFAFGRWETRYSVKKKRDEWHFIDMTLECGHDYAYAADGHSEPRHRRTAGTPPCWWKRPAIFMPRVACRLVLEVTEVRVERLQDISDADAQAEGVERSTDAVNVSGLVNGSIHCDRYARLWDDINGAGAWAANPWVWAVSFRRIEP